MQETDHLHELDKIYALAWPRMGRVSSCQSRMVLDKRRFFQHRSRKKMLREI